MGGLGKRLVEHVESQMKELEGGGVYINKGGSLRQAFWLKNVKMDVNTSKTSDTNGVPNTDSSLHTVCEYVFKASDPAATGLIGILAARPLLTQVAKKPNCVCSTRCLFTRCDEVLCSVADEANSATFIPFCFTSHVKSCV